VALLDAVLFGRRHLRAFSCSASSCLATFSFPSCVREHSPVARDLNNLATLLQATDRLAEAEPLMRGVIEILLKFTRETGHSHLDPALRNYAELMQAMGRSEAQVREDLNDLLVKYRISLGGAVRLRLGASQHPKFPQCGLRGDGSYAGTHAGTQPLGGRRCPYAIRSWGIPNLVPNSAVSLPGLPRVPVILRIQ